MQSGEHIAQRMAVTSIRRFLDAARQATEQRCWLASKHTPVVHRQRSCQWLRARQTTRCEVSHQAQIEIEGDRLDTLEERSARSAPAVLTKYWNSQRPAAIPARSGHCSPTASGASQPTSSSRPTEENHQGLPAVNNPHRRADRVGRNIWIPTKLPSP